MRMSLKTERGTDLSKGSNDLEEENVKAKTLDQAQKKKLANPANRLRAATDATLLSGPVDPMDIAMTKEQAKKEAEMRENK